MGGRGACYVPGRSRSVTSGAHKPWGIMGWPIVKAVALERFWEGGASCQNRSETVGPPTYGAYRLQGLQSYSLRRQTMEPRIRPDIKTTTFAPSVNMTSRRSLAPSPTSQSQGSGYPATHHPIGPG